MRAGSLLRQDLKPLKVTQRIVQMVVELKRNPLPASGDDVECDGTRILTGSTRCHGGISRDTGLPQRRIIRALLAGLNGP